MLMGNGAFSATADLLEKQTARLAHQARLREGAKTTAVEMARRAQVAQAEARQAAAQNAAASEEQDGGGLGGGDGGPGGPGGEKKRAAAATAAVVALEAAVVANQASEAAAAEARTLATAKGEVWLGAEALATLLAGLVECRLVDGASWTGAGAGAPGAIGVGGGGIHQGGGGGGASSSSAPSKVAHRACKAIMKQVGVLSEEELKKENQDVRISKIVWLAFFRCVFSCVFYVLLGCAWWLFFGGVMT